jgi:drug/metabolite transporter (DMT)-like permease
MNTTTVRHVTASSSPAPTSLDSPMLWPGVFILLWSSGYVAGKVGLPYAGPFTLIFLRFSVAAAILLGVALMMRAPWPSTPRQWMHIAVVGILIQALQFSGLYSGLSMGVSAGVSALIVGLMPIFTAVGAVAFLGERVNRRQVGGLCLGLVGVALAVAHKVRLDVGSTAGYLAVGLALVGITAGTLYQKKFCANMDLRTGGCIQLSVAALIVGVIGYATEGLAVQWTPALVGSSLWLSLVNSIGAISVLFLMVRRGEASRVASLFYLIPAVTAAMGYFVLGETLAPVQVLGFLVSASGVYLTTRK